jgi:hypothetical protein
MAFYFLLHRSICWVKISQIPFCQSVLVRYFQFFLVRQSKNSRTEEAIDPVHSNFFTHNHPGCNHLQLQIWSSSADEVLSPVLLLHGRRAGGKVIGQLNSNLRGHSSSKRSLAAEPEFMEVAAMTTKTAAEGNQQPLESGSGIEFLVTGKPSRRH